MTLQTGDHWFFTPNQPLHSIDDLVSFYHHSVGANGHLELDFAVSRTGQLAPAHAAAYAAFGGWIRACYGTPIATGALPAGATSFVVTIPGGGGAVVDRVRLVEDQSRGQLIIDYVVEVAATPGGAWRRFSGGTTVGATRIDVAAAAVSAAALRVNVTSGFGVPTGLTLAAFAPAPCRTDAWRYPVA